jgi:methionine-rich copper-binding protein CopC
MNPPRAGGIGTSVTNVIRIAAVVPLLFALYSVPAQGHAILLRSKPSLNEVVQGKNIPIELHFNSRVDGKRSRISLIFPGGEQRDLEIEQPSGDSLVSHAADLAPGMYVLRWQILAADGHITRGDVQFRVQ